MREPRNASGTKNTHPGGQALDEIGHGGHHVLAVVQHEQDVTLGQPLGERALVGLTA